MLVQRWVRVLMMVYFRFLNDYYPDYYKVADQPGPDYYLLFFWGVVDYW